MKIRPAQAADVAPTLAMFDGIMEWLVDRGRTEQWGTEPWSKQRPLVQRIEDRVTRGELRVAVEPRAGGGPADEEIPGKEISGEEILGVIALSGQCSEYVSPPPEPELFINLLGTSRKAKGRNVGGALIDEARAEARRRGVRLVRVDCFAGADGTLRAWYESQGFEAVEPFTVRRPGRPDWPGMLLQQYLDEEPGARPR
jgi:ribosomal protein S18 acetylase RimI-like enzyme